MAARDTNLTFGPFDPDICVRGAARRSIRIRKHIANAFQKNNSALESVSNWLKNVQCIFRRIFNAFFTYLLCRVFANRVTYRLTHPTETAIRRLVQENEGMFCLLCKNHDTHNAKNKTKIYFNEIPAIRFKPETIRVHADSPQHKLAIQLEMLQ